MLRFSEDKILYGRRYNGIEYIDDKIYVMLMSSTATNVDVDESITEIAAGAFAGCNNIMSFTESSQHFIFIKGVLYNTSFEVIAGISNMLESNEVILDKDDNVKTILPYAFYNCENLEKLYLPDTVVTISRGAFENCSALTLIYVEEDILKSII